jgi:hypothetical protein
MHGCFVAVVAVQFRGQAVPVLTIMAMGHVVQCDVQTKSPNMHDVSALLSMPCSWEQ